MKYMYINFWQTEKHIYAKLNYAKDTFIRKQCVKRLKNIEQLEHFKSGQNQHEVQNVP